MAVLIRETRLPWRSARCWKHIVSLPPHGYNDDMDVEHSAKCTVCRRALNQPQEYGNRQYCDTHIITFAKDETPIWRASVLTLGLILSTIAGVAVADLVLPASVSNSPQLLSSSTIALLPALAWLIFLYRSARTTHIDIPSSLLAVFSLAALIAAAVVYPLLNQLLDLYGWLGRTTSANRFLGNILIGGFCHALVLYAIVRYTVWPTSAFIHRSDGMLFSLAASLGYAVTLNLLFIFNLGGVTLLNGGLRLITQMSAHLASSTIIGYFLGRNRFEDMPVYYLPSGLVLGAAINGLLLYAGAELNNTQLSFAQSGFSPWPGLALNIIVLILTFAGVAGLLKRHNALTRARLGPLE